MAHRPFDVGTTYREVVKVIVVRNPLARQFASHVNVLGARSEQRRKDIGHTVAKRTGATRHKGVRLEKVRNPFSGPLRRVRRLTNREGIALKELNGVSVTRQQ